MSAEVIGAGISKLITGTVAGGAAIYVVAAALGEVPTPDVHSTGELLGLAMIAYIWTQIRGMKKEAPSNAQAVTTQPPQVPQPNPVSEFLLQHLERIAFGIDKNQVSLNEFHGDFREFRGEINARVSALERKISNRNTGEIPRPHKGE